MPGQNIRYTIVYRPSASKHITVARIDDEYLGQSVRLTLKSFSTTAAANSWIGNQASPPWLISEDGRAVTVLTRTGAHIFYFEDDEITSIAMPITTFMSMIDSSIHLFERYHYDEEVWDDDEGWIPPTEWE